MGSIPVSMEMRVLAAVLACLALGYPRAAPAAAPDAQLAAQPAAGPTTAAANTLAGLPAQWLDDQGQALDLRSLGDRRLVLTMAYASCHRICPMTIHKLQALQDELDKAGEQATFVVVGFDPGQDDPAAWHAYRRERGLTRANWLFLTAHDAGQVRRFARQLGFEFWRYDEHVMHDERVVVLAPGGALQLSAGPGHILHASDLSTGT